MEDWSPALPVPTLPWEAALWLAVLPVSDTLLCPSPSSSEQQLLKMGHS